MEVVLQAGQALLGQQQDLPKTLNRDVVLAMALSYVELSREAMAEAPPAVVKSCSLLESALKLLEVLRFVTLPFVSSVINVEFVGGWEMNSGPRLMCSSKQEH